MTYKNFISLIQMDLEKELNSDDQIAVKEVRKNNGVVLDALTIQTNESGITPCIYLNGYYDQFQIGRSISSIVREIVTTHEESKEIGDQQYAQAMQVLDFNTIKDSIYYRVVNADMNKELLCRVPHKKYLDLAIVYSYLCGESEDGIGSITIQNSFLNSWDYSTDDLHDIAVANTMRLFPAKIRSMEEMLADMLGNEMFSTELESGNANQSMYVLTNTRGINGASTMFYPLVLKQFVTNCKEITEQIVILPSSIHESILIPMSLEKSISELTQMVREINETQVARDEVLSNHIYCYSVIDDQIRMVQEDVFNE